MKELAEATAVELAELLRRRELSAAELVEACLRRVEEEEARIHAFITPPDGAAREAAREADRRRAGGDTGPLLGLPVALKDNLCTRGVRTTAGSRILEPYVPPYDATVVARLREAGAVPFGKTNLDEFAMGSSTEHSAFGPTRNPWDPGRVPGGSSGGSAAAVAAGMAPLALGSDTGGSIRQPAAFCGVVGLKPTYGRVSRYGLIAFASSLDQIGPFGRCVADVALLYQAIAGHDPLDSTSVDRPVGDPLGAARRGAAEGPAGLRIGVVREYLGEGVAPDVRAAVEGAVQALAGAGARVEEVSLPLLEVSLPVYYLIAPAEASSNLARYDGVRYGFRAPGAPDVASLFARTRGMGFGPEVKRRIMLGTYALSAGYYDAYYLRAQKVRTLIRRAFEEAFRRFDVLVTPTSPTTAFPFGARLEDPTQMYLADICTVTANLAGVPGLSLPCGLGADGLPVGLQILGPPFGEEVVLRAAAAYEVLRAPGGLPKTGKGEAP